MIKVVTLEGMGASRFFINKREIEAENKCSKGIIFTTDDGDSYDDMVYVTMSQFLKKKRNGDFALVEDNSGVLVGYSKFIFIK